MATSSPTRGSNDKAGKQAQIVEIVHYQVCSAAMHRHSRLQSAKQGIERIIEKCGLTIIEDVRQSYKHEGTGGTERADFQSWRVAHYFRDFCPSHELIKPNLRPNHGHGLLELVNCSTWGKSSILRPVGASRRFEEVRAGLGPLSHL